MAAVGRGCCCCCGCWRERDGRAGGCDDDDCRKENDSLMELGQQRQPHRWPPSANKTKHSNSTLKASSTSAVVVVMWPPPPGGDDDNERDDIDSNRTNADVDTGNDCCDDDCCDDDDKNVDGDAVATSAFVAAIDAGQLKPNGSNCGRLLRSVRVPTKRNWCG